MPPAIPRSRQPRLLVPAALLAVALVLTIVLAYQAEEAVRSHETTATRTLTEYASFANWQLTQQAKNGLMTAIMMSVGMPASRIDPTRLEETLLTPEALERESRELTDSWCHCLNGARYFFRYDWPTGAFRTTATELPDSDLAWARDTLLAYARTLPAVNGRVPLTFGSPDGRDGPLRRLDLVFTNESYAMLFGSRRREQALLVFAIARSVHGDPIAAYGYEIDPASFVTPMFRFIHQRNALLPASLVHGLAPDSILSVSVRTIGGSPIFDSPQSFTPLYAAADTIEPNFGQLVVRVAIRPSIAGRLIVGGLPRSRLPMLLALVLLTAGLLGVALFQLRRQEELARLRTEFVSGVSHELRTPLAQIRWFAELLHLGKLRSEAERLRSAAIIDQEARRLTYLVESILSFARAERATARITPTPLVLRRAVDEIAELIEPIASARRMNVSVSVPDEIIVMADKDALKQILLNLIDNAVKYGPPGQTVTVGGSLDGDHAVISIEDEGEGIPFSERERIWEPYVRLLHDNDGSTGGSGIGLAVVRELVGLHGGRAWVERRRLGHGARFNIELTAIRPWTALPPQTPAAPPPSSHSSVS